MKIYNWFLFMVAVLEICAAIWYLKNKSPLLAYVQICYAGSNVFLSMMKGI